MKIETTILGGNLFDGGGDWDKVDLGASASKYASLVESAIEKEFPDAEVIVNLQQSTSGYSGQPCIDLSSDEQEEWSKSSVQELVTSIKGDIYSDYQWIVWIVNQ